MHRNQWKTAGDQLLTHWRRSGITQIPVGTPKSIATALEWFDNNVADVEPALIAAVEPSALTSREPTAPPAGESPPTLLPTLPKYEASQAQAPQAAVTGIWNTPSQDFVSRQTAFESLNAQVIACRKCEDIVCRRQRTVFGVGPVTARIVMFGEAPGADEDRIGEPFVGAAGQLMDKILVASGLKREDVYIMNSLKCRPPNNRTPADTEIENCRPFFETQLETIQPEYIVCWGSIAVRAVLKSTESVGRLRGKFHSYRGAKVLVTYHPAYLLRNPDAKRLTWEDMKMLMREIGIPVPGKS